jgi:hypothetical protein
VFVRQFPLLANGEAAGEGQQYVSGGQQCLTFRWDKEGGTSAFERYKHGIFGGPGTRETASGATRAVTARSSFTAAVGFQQEARTGVHTMDAAVSCL